MKSHSLYRMYGMKISSTYHPINQSICIDGLFNFIMISSFHTANPNITLINNIQQFYIHKKQQRDNELTITQVRRVR